MYILKIAGVDLKWKPWIAITEDGVTNIDLTYEERIELMRLLAAAHPKDFAEIAHQRLGVAPDLSRFSTDCPTGYDTIIGWVAKNRYDIIENLGTAAWLHTRDGFWLTHQCRARDQSIHKVEAPAVLKEQGIQQVNAYPVELIAERFAD